MHKNLLDILDIILCPHCQEALTLNENQNLICHNCNVTYQSLESGSLDLRLKTLKEVPLKFKVGQFIASKDINICQPLQLNPLPQVDFTNIPAPFHLSREIMSYFPKATGENSLMLDLGCGNTIPKSVHERTGFKYIGLDYNNSKASLLGDAHALPFKDQSFEFVLSLSVLEHIQFPFVTMNEVYRVLKLGGIFIGTVAFLEPFHMQSYYHHTHLGIWNALQHAGFEVEWIAPEVNWTVFTAQTMMEADNFFPKMPKTLSQSIMLLPDQLSKLWWTIGRVIKRKRKKELARAEYPITGSFAFMAKKLV